LKVAHKVWLDNEGKAFGEGPYQLLKRIEERGSLAAGNYRHEDVIPKSDLPCAQLK